MIGRHRPLVRTGRWALLIVMLAAIFVADTITDLEIAVAVFYVTVVLIAAGFLRMRDVLVVSTICIMLTLTSFTFTRSGAYEAGVVNCVLSLCAIGITTYLVLTRSSAILAEHEAREQLVRLARVNALGELAASIAHEVNQPLTAVINSGNAGLRWLAADPPSLPKAQQALERIVSDANRASNVVARVRSLSARADPSAEWLSAAALVSEVVALSRGEMDQHHIAVVTRVEDDLPLVFADGVQVQQVLLNILLNALEAMEGIPPEQRELRIELSHHEGFVRFTVIDRGRGLSPDDAEHIFDAFRSSKSEGIGIGLAVSRSIVESHGGRIWARPRPEGGAEFNFTLRGHRLGAW